MNARVTGVHAEKFQLCECIITQDKCRYIMVAAQINTQATRLAGSRLPTEPHREQLTWTMPATWEPKESLYTTSPVLLRRTSIFPLAQPVTSSGTPLASTSKLWRHIGWFLDCGREGGREGGEREERRREGERGEERGEERGREGRRGRRSRRGEQLIIKSEGVKEKLKLGSHHNQRFKEQHNVTKLTDGK